MACQFCRRHKRRCNAVKPTCGTCAKRSPPLLCVYESTSGGKSRTARQLELLQSRITELEQTRALNTQLSTLPLQTAEGSVTQALVSTNQKVPYEPEAFHESLQQKVQGDRLHYDLGEASSRTAERQDEVNPRQARTCVLETLEIPTPPVITIRQIGLGNHSNIYQPSTQSRLPAINSHCNTTEDDHLGVELGNYTPSNRYFGRSSALTFMRQVQSVLDEAGWAQDLMGEGGQSSRHGTPVIGQNVVHPGNLSGLSNSRSSHSSRLNYFVVPYRREADVLVESYWTWVNSLYPFLNRVSFQKKYNEIWSSTSGLPQPNSVHKSQSSSAAVKDRMREDEDCRLFYCILNGVFALGCQFEPSIEFVEKSARSHVFWQRAKSLLELDLDIFNNGKLQLVQASLIMGLYLQSTELTGACWNLISIAIRSAQALGLHESVSQLGRQDEEMEDTGLRRRLWGGCVLLDRSLSMTYGRPLMISPKISFIPDIQNNRISRLDTAIDLECDTTAHISSYQKTLELHEILGGILAELYDSSDVSRSDSRLPPNLQHTRADIIKAQPFVQRIRTGDFQSLLKFDDALLLWRSQLPQNLTLQYYDTPPTVRAAQDHYATDFIIPKRQAVVLHARYLHIRILLFRPLLVKHLADSQGTNGAVKDENEHERSILRDTLSMQASVMCITTAQELASLLTDNVLARSQTVPEWWCTVYCKLLAETWSLLVQSDISNRFVTDLYTCATVQLAGWCSASLCRQVGRVGLQHSWKKCLAGLRLYRSCSLTARRCCRVLDLIDRRVWGCGNGITPTSTTAAFSAPRSGPRSSRNSTGFVAPDPAALQRQNDAYVTTPASPWFEMQGMPGLQGLDMLDWDQRPLEPELDIPIDSSPTWTKEQIDVAWLSYLPFQM